MCFAAALVAKAHFEPHLDPTRYFDENRMAAEGIHGPWHELATHGSLGGHHYADWMWSHVSHMDLAPTFCTIAGGPADADNARGVTTAHAHDAR